MINEGENVVARRFRLWRKENTILLKKQAVDDENEVIIFKKVIIGVRVCFSRRTMLLLVTGPKLLYIDPEAIKWREWKYHEVLLRERILHKDITILTYFVVYHQSFICLSYGPAFQVQLALGVVPYIQERVSRCYSFCILVLLIVVKINSRLLLF